MLQGKIRNLISKETRNTLYKRPTVQSENNEKNISTKEQLLKYIDGNENLKKNENLVKSE